jgi:hypothetical protein
MTLYEFDLKDIDYFYKGKIIKLKAKNINLIISVIAESIYRNGLDENGYAVVSANKFREAYTGYKIYVNYLIEFFKIERNYYVAGQKSYGYRLTERFKEELKIKNIILDYNNKKLKRSMRNNIKSDQYLDLMTFPYCKRLKTDFLGCEIDYYLHKNQLVKTKDEWGHFIDIGKWFINNVYIYKWKKRRIVYHFTTNRLYTNFVYLSKHIRINNVKLSGENLFEFDISNSYPLMLALYCIKAKLDLQTFSGQKVKLNS